MRHLGRATAALAVTACALAAIAAPAMGADEFTANEFGKVFTKNSPGKIKAVGDTAGPALEEEVQKFKLGAFKLQCPGARAKLKDEESGKPAVGAKATGTVTEEAFETLTVPVKFSQCESEIKNGTGPGDITWLPVKFRTTLVFVYHAKKWVDVGSEAVEEEGPGEVTIRRAEEPVVITLKPGQCTLEIPEQTLPNNAEVKEEDKTFKEVTFDNVTSTPPEKEWKLFPEIEPGEGHIQHSLAIHNELKKITVDYVAPGQCAEEPTEFEKEETKTGTIDGTLLTKVVKGNLEWHE